MPWKPVLLGSPVVALIGVGAMVIPGITSDGLAPDQSLQTATRTLMVSGMTCAGCAVAVKMAASGVDGVTDVDVSYEHGGWLAALDDFRNWLIRAA